MRYSANKDDEPNRSLLADLSALADGTIDPARESTVREQIAASPRLRERYERERRAVAALYATRADRAPARLRARIEAQRRGAEHADGGWLVPRSRFAYGGFAAVVAAAVAVALLLPGGAPGGPSVSEAAALALRGSGRPAPAPDPRNPAATLSKDVEEVYFPNWPSWFGWSAAGLRTDRLAGRQAVTVYYRNHHGQQVAYTIVAAPALRRPGTAARSVNDTTLQQLKLGKRMVITWRRAGHTCVLSGIGVSWGELARLAAWKPAGVTS